MVRLKEPLFLFFLFIFYSLSYFWLTRNGLLKTFDSHLYLQYAEKFKACGCVTKIRTGLPYWPPLFPFILAISGEYLVYFQFLASVALLLIWYLIAKTILSPNSLLFFVFLFAFNILHFTSVVFLWSEIWAMLFFSIGIWLLLKYERSPSLLYFCGFVAFFSLQLLTRNISVLLLGALTMGWLIKWTSLSVKITCGILLSFLPYTGWVFWNGLYDRYDEMEKTFQTISTGNMITIVANEIAGIWAPFLQMHFILSYLIVIPLFACMIFSFKNRKKHFDMAWMAIFCGVYLLFWVFIHIPKDEFSRYLSPVAPILVLLPLYALDQWPHGLKDNVLKNAALLYMTLFCLFRFLKHVEIWS